MAQSAISKGAPPVLARAHHGSVSREQRQQTEEDLKAGRLPAVVATSSLELGIDMGAVDLVIQVESPPSVASGLQRVGRAGHQVGAVSRGVLFPKFRGDLVQTAVIVERMRSGAIEALRVPANPLDVLAQQIVAMVALDEWTVTDLEALVRRSAPFAGLTRPVLESVLDMLSGPTRPTSSPSCVRAWSGTGSPTPSPDGAGAQRLAVTSRRHHPRPGPVRGVPRRLGGARTARRRAGRGDGLRVAGGRRVHPRHVVVADRGHHPRPGAGHPRPRRSRRGCRSGRATRWAVRPSSDARWAPSSARSPASSRGRRARAGAGRRARRVGSGQPAGLPRRTARGDRTAPARPAARSWNDSATRSGDWRVVVHSPFGAQVHAPWSLVVAARLRERYGVDVQAMHADDGLVFRLPDTEWAGGRARGRLVPSTRRQAQDRPGSGRAEPQPPVRRSSNGPPRRTAGADLPRPRRGRRAVSPSRSAARRCSPPGSGSAPDGPCCCPSAVPTSGRPCGSSDSGPPSCSRWPASTRASRSCWRPSASASTTSSTCPAWSRCCAASAPREIDHGRGRDPQAVAVRLLPDVRLRRAVPLRGRLAAGRARAAALALDPTLLAELLGTTEGLSLAELLDPEALTRTERGAAAPRRAPPGQGRRRAHRCAAGCSGR